MFIQPGFECVCCFSGCVLSPSVKVKASVPEMIGKTELHSNAMSSF